VQVLVPKIIIGASGQPDDYDSYSDENISVHSHALLKGEEIQVGLSKLFGFSKLKILNRKPVPNP